MGLTIRQREKIARTEATLDQVYAGLAAMGGGGAKGTGLFIFRPITLHAYMRITWPHLSDIYEIIDIGKVLTINYIFLLLLEYW
jgi:hypothetical protein